MINSIYLRRMRRMGLFNNNDYIEDKPPNGFKPPWLAILLGTCLVLFVIFGHGCAYGADEITAINIAIIAQIESSNNPNAYNNKSGTIGLCQITKPVLADFNKAFKRHYDINDLYIEQVNIMIAEWYLNTKIPQYLKHYGIEDSIRNRLWAYNAGIGKVKKGIMPQETKDYIIKYEDLSAKEER